MKQNDSLPLKYIGYAIVCTEVPDEISLAFNISGCPYRCEGCHSKYLWEYNGNYLKEDILTIVEQYKKLITCVCFMGGDQNIEEIEDISKHIKEEYKLKICIYSGCNSLDKFLPIIKNKTLDYLKIGEYKDDFGGLSQKTTNQIMYKIVNKNEKVELIDITRMFQKG